MIAATSRSRRALREETSAHGSWWIALCLAASACATPSRGSSDASRAHEDLESARQLFQRNIAAIQGRNKELYLSCYRESERLVRAGPEGVKLGFSELATSTPTTASDAWPERLEAENLEVQWIAPGVVYGSYRYRVTYDGATTTGVSERVFLEEEGSWTIAVTTAFPAADVEE